MLFAATSKQGIRLDGKHGCQTYASTSKEGIRFNDELTTELAPRASDKDSSGYRARSQRGKG